MEYYQQIQNRAGQTVAVINDHIPTLKVGNLDSSELTIQSEALDALAQDRDNAITASDEGVNTEQMGYLAIRALTFSLPRAATGELDEGSRRKPRCSISSTRSLASSRARPSWRSNTRARW